MSKFLLNLLLQISKALIYSKIKLLFGKDFFPHFRPNRPSGQPAHPVFRPSCDHFFFNRPLPLSPLGLGLSAGPAGHALVAPCSIAASLMGKHLTSHCLHPSPCPADRWAPIVITFLRLRPSLAVTPPHLATSVHHSTPRDAAPVPLPPPPPPPSITPLNPSLCRLTFYGVKAITADRFYASSGRSPPLGPYKRARSTPGHHHTHRCPPLLAPEFTTPTSPSTDRHRHCFPPSPGHLATARAPVRPEPSSSCSSLSVVPLPMSFCAPEWPEAMIR
jgi:hypothetical protein